MDQSAVLNTAIPSPTTGNDRLHVLNDNVLNWIFGLGTVVGVLGNSCSVCFFWPRRKKTIHDMLYLSISAVDLITILLVCTSTVPFLGELGLFRNEVFVGVWDSVMAISIKFSIFLAMVICVTRTMIMKYPKRPIYRSWIISAIIGYFILLVFFDVLTISIRWMRSKRPFISLFMDHGYGFVDYLAMTLQIFAIFTPSLIIFICFIVGIRILLTRPALSSENSNGFRRVSITISIFTAIFLFFNIPCTIKLIWNLLILFDLTSYYDILPNDGKTYIDQVSIYAFADFFLVILPMFRMLLPTLYCMSRE